MRIVVATTTGFHLRHIAAQCQARGHRTAFLSYLPRWKTRQYGFADENVRSFFLGLQPHASLALWRRSGSLLSAAREQLLVKTDRAVAREIPPCDIFVGLSAMAVESAHKARAQYGARVVIERGSSHVLEQVRIQKESGALPVSERYVARELESYDAADLVVVPSRFAATTFLKHGFPQDRLAVVMLGTDSNRFRAGPVAPQLPVRAIFVGNWSRRKGADLLAAAMRSFPDLAVTHVGIPLDVALPDNPRFNSLGYLDHTALSEVLRHHHILVFPSRDDGFGMVMAEAIASGLRVVASDASGAPDLADAVGSEYVRVCDAGSVDALVDALADQIAAIESDPTGFRPGLKEAQALSWQGYGDRYEALLQTFSPTKIV